MTEAIDWIDIHTHLDMIDGTMNASIESAKSVGVNRLITIGTQPDDHEFILDTVNKFPGVVFGTLGVHPHEAQTWNHDVFEFIKKNSKNPGIVAVGEIGLDYFYKNSDPNIQKAAFREQMSLASELKLPVEIHTRDAEEDTIQILKEFNGKVIGVLHCFTSSWNLAEAALDMGYDISCSGIVTFKNASDLRETMKRVPLDRLHVETDSPFLSPVPVRGVKNTSSHLVHTAKFVAELKGIPLPQFSIAMKQNAERLFPKLKS